MDIKFSKDSADNQQAGAEKKGSQNVLLVVLLVLACIVGYVYFFTGLITPMPEQKVAEVPAATSQVTKKPLPSSEGAPTKADAVAGEANKDVAVPAAKPESAPVAPAAAPAKVEGAKPAVKESAQPKKELKTAEEALPSVKKPLPAAGKAGAIKPAAVEKKQLVVAVNKPQPAKEAEKKPAAVKKPAEKQAAAVTAVAKVKKEHQKPVKKEVTGATGMVTDSGNWTVLVGNYVLEEALATDLARVRKAGLEAFIVPGPHKKTHMNRLLLAEFTDRDSAQAELTKLKRLTADAFMIDNATMHVVYAGSYLLDSRASSEKERLAAAGFKLTVKRADVAIPTKNLTAGSFAEKSAAADVLKKLRAAGVKATLSRQ